LAQEGLFDTYQRTVYKLGELFQTDKPVHLFTVKVQSIGKPKLDEVTGTIKHVNAKIIVKKSPQNSVINANIEFLGRTVILSRQSGDCDLDDLANRLSREYSVRYPKESLKPDRIPKKGKVQHYVISDPQHFLDFLHLVKTKELEIFSREGENPFPQWLQWMKETNLGSK